MKQHRHRPRIRKEISSQFEASQLSSQTGKVIFFFTLNRPAAGIVLFLALILITACGALPAVTGSGSATASKNEAVDKQSEPDPTPQPAEATALPTQTPTSANRSPRPTQIHDTPTRTPTQARPGLTPAAEDDHTAGSRLKVYETTITLATYPIKDYLIEEVDPVYNIPVFYFQRAEFEAAALPPVPVDYAGVVLENPYLRLTVLPELGGRLYSAVVKATGQEVFYHNPVIKASRYGVLQPYEANWWLATGGMEWAYPTQEHGYRFGVPWDYDVTQDIHEATITLSDTGPDRVGLQVQVTLPAGGGLFTVEPQLINNGPDSAPVQLWTNAALTLGGESMSPETRFIVPHDTIMVHSRGEPGWTVPDARQQAPWPQVGETDLRDYRQWANYLGFFVPNQETPFVGAYNPETDLAIVRIPDSSAGSGKLFAFGLDFPDRSYTDDKSQYFEIWGGANAGFWPEDDITVAVGETLGWKESWWPLPGLNGLTWASDRAAIYLDRTADRYLLSARVSGPTEASLQVWAGDTVIMSEPISAGPDTVMEWEFSAKTPPTRIQISDDRLSLLNYLVDEEIRR